MTQIPVQFIDPSGRIIAAAEVMEANGLFRGNIDLAAVPAPTRRVFAQYEETVNNQSFSLLDEIEDTVSQLKLRVRFGAQAEFAIKDLQIYRSSARVSFRLAQHDFAAAADYVLKKNAALYERLA